MQLWSRINLKWQQESPYPMDNSWQSLSAYTPTEDFRMEGILISNNNLTSKRFSYPVSTTGRTCHSVKQESVLTSQLLTKIWSEYPRPPCKVIDDENFYNTVNHHNMGNKLIGQVSKFWQDEKRKERNESLGNEITERH